MTRLDDLQRFGVEIYPGAGDGTVRDGLHPRSSTSGFAIGRPRRACSSTSPTTGTWSTGRRCPAGRVTRGTSSIDQDGRPGRTTCTRPSECRATPLAPRLAEVARRHPDRGPAARGGRDSSGAIGHGSIRVGSSSSRTTGSTAPAERGDDRAHFVRRWEALGAKLLYPGRVPPARDDDERHRPRSAYVCPLSSIDDPPLSLLLDRLG